MAQLGRLIAVWGSVLCLGLVLGYVLLPVLLPAAVDLASTNTTTIDQPDENQSDMPILNLNDYEHVSSDNPFGERTVTVTADHRNTIHNNDRYIIAAIDYWNINGDAYLDYPISLKYDRDSGDGDIRIKFVDEIENCGEHSGDAVGCGPLNDNFEDKPARLQVESNLSGQQMETTIMHEMGHALGLDHGDKPQSIMTNDVDLGWRYAVQNPRYHIGSFTQSGPRTEQTSVAIDYLESGAEKTIDDPPDFSRALDERDATFIFVFASDGACGGNLAVCSEHTDYQGQIRIIVADDRVSLTAWYLASSLISYYVDSPSEYPPVLRDSTGYKTASSRWWEGRM